MYLKWKNENERSEEKYSPPESGHVKKSHFIKGYYIKGYFHIPGSFSDALPRLCARIM